MPTAARTARTPAASSATTSPARAPRFSDTFTGSISCLAANGDRAAAGAVGSWRHRGPATILFTAVDRGAEEDTINIVDTAGSAPPDCANASFANQGQIIIPDHELI